MTLAARKLLMEETSEQLECLYGFVPDGTLKPRGNYPVLKDMSEAGQTRERLRHRPRTGGVNGLLPRCRIKVPLGCRKRMRRNSSNCPARS